LEQIVRQQQEQITTLQILIAQAGLEEVVREEVVVSQPNIGSNIGVVKLQTFNGELGKMVGFLTACKLYIRIWKRKAAVKEQIQ